MNRFFAFEKQNNCLILDQNALNHLKVISRSKNKEFIVVYEKKFYRCVLHKLNHAKIIEQIDINNELGFEIILAPSIIKFPRFEWLLEKAVELGVTKIIPIISQHVLGELVNYNKFEKKYTRFNEILKNAAQQSFRNQLVILEKPLTFNEAIKLDIKNKFIAHEKTNIQNNNIINNIKDQVIFFIGPEGGYSDIEIEMALANNAKIISLGKRILRAETASLYCLSQLKDVE